MEPLGMISAMRAVEQHVNSARPDAPVVEERGSFIDPVRDATARALRRLADRLEPSAPTRAPGRPTVKLAEPCR